MKQGDQEQALIQVRGLTQTAVLRKQWALLILYKMVSLFNKINVLLRLAFGPVDTVHENECSDKRFSQIQGSLEAVC